MSEQKEIKARLVKCLLELVILQLLKENEMHGYQTIKSIRKEYGVYLGPSTIYPLLNVLERRKLIRGKWEIHKNRPRKTYCLTICGRNRLHLSIALLAQLNLTIDLQKGPSTTEKAVGNIPSALA
jgi:DNA-binding PadR family transcriptional regulator